MLFRKATIGLVSALILLVSPALAQAGYTVKPGDTLSGIAQEHNSTWPELHKLNPQIDNPDLIYPGQVIEVEKKKKKKSNHGKAKSKHQPATGSVTSSYGMRTHPITGVHKLHTGTDYSYGDGKAYAAKSGTVVAVTYDAAYGNLVTIRHSGGVETRYAHLAAASVKTNQKVKAGDVIGEIGSTGYSTGPHLHFEVLKNGEFINPKGWLKKK